MPTEVTPQIPEADQPLSADQVQAAWAEELASRSTSPATTAALEGDEAQPDAGQPAADTTTQTAQPAAEKQPWEKRLDALEASNKTLETELGRANGRVAALQSKLDRGSAAAQQVKDAPTQQQQEAAAEDPAEWKQLMEDFPEWGVAFKKKIDADMARVAKQFAAQPGAEAPDVASIVDQAVAKREFARVDRRHPGWRETVKTPAFTDWFKTQAPEVQALAESDDSDDALDMLNQFKAATATSKATDITTRRNAVANAAAVNGKPRQPSAAVSTDPADLTPKQLWDLEMKNRAKKRAA